MALDSQCKLRLKKLINAETFLDPPTDRQSPKTIHWYLFLDSFHGNRSAKSEACLKRYETFKTKRFAKIVNA